MSRARDLADFGSNATSYDAVEIDQYRLTSNFSTNDAVITSWERVDNASFAKVGSGITQSSGVFSFPNTGVYKVSTNVGLRTGTSDAIVAVRVEVSLDNETTYDLVAYLSTGGDTAEDERSNGLTAVNLINVTNISNVKFRLKTNSFASGALLEGDTNFNRTSIMFERITDSQ